MPEDKDLQQIEVAEYEASANTATTVRATLDRMPATRSELCPNCGINTVMVGPYPRSSSRGGFTYQKLCTACDHWIDSGVPYDVN